MEQVLEDGTLGMRLHATEIHDRLEVVRLVHSDSSFHNPVLSKTVELSWWNVLILILSLLIGVIGYLLAVVSDLLKDESLKPLAKRILISLHILNSAPLTKVQNGNESKKIE